MLGDTGNRGSTVRSITPKSPPPTALQAALDYAALGWPVVPGAVWRDGRFVSPVDERPVTSPCLRPVEEATTDTTSVREWWSVPGLHEPNVFTVTGPDLGAFMVAERLVMALADDPGFAVRPTPVLAFHHMPPAYFLVRPPVQSLPAGDEARVLAAGLPMPLPRSALGTTSAIWLVTPEQAGEVLLPGEELADLIQRLGRKSA
jgi:hypothetical protein